MPLPPWLLRPVAAGGFNPLAVPQLFAWYDASDSASVTLSGTGISQINDKSGNGRHLSQADATAQPAYLPNGINGRAVIAPDGSNDRLFANVASFAPQYIVGAFMPRSTKGGAYVKTGDNNNGVGIGQGATTFDNNGLVAIAIHENVAWRVSGITLALNQAVIYSYRYQNSAFRVSPLGAGSAGSMSIINGARISLGGYGAPRFTDGYIGEVLIYETAPPNAAIMAIEQYLGRKWGVPVLPI